MSQRPGFALIFALWASLALALIGTLLLHRTRDAAAGTSLAMQQARTAASDEAATSLAILALLDSKNSQARVDGTPFQIALPQGETYEVSIQDQNGLVDLNRATPDMLRALFRAANCDDATADTLTQALLDTRPAGIPTIDALRTLPGMTADLFARLTPALTIFAGTDSINPQTAPPLALRAAGLTAEEAQAMLAQRDAHPPAGLSSMPLAAGILDPAIMPTGWVFAVRVRPRTPPGALRETILRLASTPARPLMLLAQRRLP